MAGMQSPIGEQPMGTDRHTYALNLRISLEKGLMLKLTHFSCPMSAKSAATCKILA